MSDEETLNGIERRIEDARWRVRIETRLKALEESEREHRQMTAEAVTFIRGMKTLGSLIKIATTIVGGIVAFYYFAKTGDARFLRGPGE